MGNLHRFLGPSLSLRRAQTAAAAGLSLLFVLVYGATNWYASTRPVLGAVYFEWERAIPFIAVLIVPYMSIDAFFVAAPFFARDRAELGVLSRRVALATLAAGTCFALVPLRFAFERPVPDGWTGPIFRLLHGFDQPHNLLPSLHIAYGSILIHHYAGRTSGLLRWAVCAWFALIGVSAVLTYQHHVADVAGGLVLAALTFYAVPEGRSTWRFLPSVRLAAYYGAAAAAAALFAIVARPCGVVLLWPSAALGIVAAGYLRAGPAVFRKSGGRIPWSAKLVLAPVLAGQSLSLRYYRRRSRAWDEVVPGLFIGRVLNEREARELLRSGVKAVLDLTSEFDEAGTLTRLSYLNLPVLDLTAPAGEMLDRAVAFLLEEHAEGRGVYVHCKIGYSRTAAVVGAYLLAAGIATSTQEAIESMRRARPSLVVRPEARDAIERYERKRAREGEPPRCARS